MNKIERIKKGRHEVVGIKELSETSVNSLTDNSWPLVPIFVTLGDDDDDGIALSLLASTSSKHECGIDGMLPEVISVSVDAERWISVEAKFLLTFRPPADFRILMRILI